MGLEVFMRVWMDKFHCVSAPTTRMANLEWIEGIAVGMMHIDLCTKRIFQYAIFSAEDAKQVLLAS